MKFMDFHEFAVNVEKIKSKLYKTALLYLSNESLALDAVDEAVYKGLKSIKKLKNDEYFNTWMMRILINECKQELRRRKKEEIMEVIPEESVEIYDSLPLKDAIKRLPCGLREVIILRYFADLTLTDTAKCLNIPQGTAATRQRKALELLKLDFLIKDDIYEQGV